MRKSRNADRIAKQKGETPGVKENVVDSLKLPKDLMFVAVILTVTGQCEAYVENYRGIIEYTKERIRLQTKTCQLEMKGTNLHIDYYTNDELKITGRIIEIHYT